MSRHGPDFFPKGRFLIIQNPRIIAVCSSSTSRLDPRSPPPRPSLELDDGLGPSASWFRLRLRQVEAY